MDKIDLDVQTKDVFGSIDRLLVNLGMVLIAFFPTHLLLILRPKQLAVLLLGEEEDGRIALRLGPGITFVLTCLFLLGVVYVSEEVLKLGVGASQPASDVDENNGIRAAISEGNFWRTILLALPMYFLALFLGIAFHLSHVICRLKANLTQSVGVGLYVESTFLTFVIAVGIIAETNETEAISIALAVLVLLVFFIVMPWQYYSFSRHAFNNSKRGAIIASILTCLFYMAGFAAIIILFA